MAANKETGYEAEPSPLFTGDVCGFTTSQQLSVILNPSVAA